MLVLSLVIWALILFFAYRRTKSWRPVFIVLGLYTLSAVVGFIFVYVGYGSLFTLHYVDIGYTIIKWGSNLAALIGIFAVIAPQWFSNDY